MSKFSKSMLSLLCLVGVTLQVRASEPVTIESLLQEMIDRDAVVRFPERDFRLKQHSSYNCASKTPADEKGWFMNHDYNSSDKDKNFIRIEDVNGQKEWVLMDHQGAGALVRTWMPWHKQQSAETTTTMRIYFDGAEEPAIEGNMLASSSPQPGRSHVHCGIPCDQVPESIMERFVVSRLTDIGLFLFM